MTDVRKNNEGLRDFGESSDDSDYYWKEEIGQQKRVEKIVLYIIHALSIIFTLIPMLVVFTLIDFFVDKSWTIWLYVAAVGLEGIWLFYWFTIKWPLMQRDWADGKSRLARRWSEEGQPIFWVRLPEMHAAFVLKDRKLHRVLIAASGPRRNYFQYWIKNRQSEYPNVHYEIVESGQELIWIGLPFGSKYTIRTWYEDSKDLEAPEEQPRSLLTLAERTMDWAPEQTTSTADPIEVNAELVVSLLVIDPTRAAFAIQHYLEIIRKDIEAILRQVMTQVRYFKPEDQESGGAGSDSTGDVPSEDEPPTENLDRYQIKQSFSEIGLTVNPDLQQQVYFKLNKALGISLNNDGDGIYSVGNSKSGIESRLVPLREEGGSIASKIEQDYGMVLSKPVLIRDLNPADKEIVQAIRSMTSKRTELINQVLEAEATRQTARRKADGEAYAIDQKTEALKRRMAGLKLEDGMPLIAQELIPEAIKGSKMTILGMEGLNQFLGLGSVFKQIFQQSTQATTDDSETNKEGSE